MTEDSVKSPDPEPSSKTDPETIIPQQVYEGIQQQLSATDYSRRNYHGASGCTYPGVTSITVRTLRRTTFE